MLVDAEIEVDSPNTRQRMCHAIFPPSNHLTGFNTFLLAVHIHLPSLFSSASEESFLPYSILAKYGSMKVTQPSPRQMD